MSGPAEFDIFGEVVKDPHGSLLGDEFMIPPFSVLNAREGWWQERKRKWLALGIQSELGRGDNLSAMGGQSNDVKPSSGGGNDAAPGGSARPACDYRNRQRGDGRGRAIG